MWLRDPIDVEVTRNSQSPIGLQFWDEAANAPLDVSDFTFSCRVGLAEGTGLLTTFTCTVVDGSQGAIDINFDGTALASQPGMQDIVTLSYQVLATGGAITVTAMRGSLILTPGIR